MTIQPALTPEEWADDWLEINEAMLIRGAELYVYAARYEDGDQRRHALAALALHGQPFGFTQEDVVRLRAIADYLDSPNVTASEDAWFVIALADRVAALLPPPS